MIETNVVRKLVDEWLEDKDYFLTDLTISPDDRIVVEIDHQDGVWIEDCVALSRFIEDGLDRDAEDSSSKLAAPVSDSHSKCSANMKSMKEKPWRC